MAVIHFGSGATIEISESDCKKLIHRLKDAATRLWDDRKGIIVVLSPSVIDYIVYTDKSMPRQFITDVKEVPNTKTPDKGPSLQEREADAMAEMIAKSECEHIGTFKVYYQEVSKKDGSTWKRYFKQCSFCKFKSKFIGEADLTEEEKTEATIYQEK